MKTPEQWADILNEQGPDELTIDTIHAIQQDAMKAGMEKAAKIVLLLPTTYKHGECGNDPEMHAHLAGETDMINKSKTAILDAAEQL